MKLLGRLSVVSLFFLGLSFGASHGATIYYARCNLKVLNGTEINWVNWQAAPTYIPVGTPLRVTIKGRNTASLRDEKKDREYVLDMGGKGELYLSKFLTEKPVDFSNISGDVLANIKKGVARNGMTKQEVYMAMGPPVKLPVGDTQKMGYEEIMKYDLWIYARRRFSKQIGIAFDPETGRVNRTEGIWK